MSIPLHYRTAEGATVVDEAERIVSAVITTGNQDSDGDIIETKGIQISNFLKNPVVLFAHDTTSMPIGKVISLDVHDNAIHAQVQFADTDSGREAFKMFADGYLRGWSIGFIPLDYDQLKTGGKVFRRVELKELSAVPVPANAEALAKCLSGTKSKELRKGIEKACLPSSYLIHDSKPYGKTFNGVKIAEGAFTRSIRNGGFPLPPGYALRIQAVEKTFDDAGNMTITQARVLGVEKALEGPDPTGPSLRYTLRRFGDMWQLIQETVYQDDPDDKSYSSVFLSRDEIDELFSEYMETWETDEEVTTDEYEKDEELKKLVDIVKKAGRKLSGRNRGRISELLKELGRIKRELRSLFNDTAPIVHEETKSSELPKPVEVTESKPQPVQIVPKLDAQALRYKALKLLYPGCFEA